MPVLQLANPDLDGTDALSEILRESAAEIDALLNKEKLILAKSEEQESDLISYALANVAQRLGVDNIAELFKKDSAGNDSLQNLAAAPRHAIHYARS